MDTEETFFLALKAHRESKGIEIDEISDYTKINPKYLNAIEEGNFNIIPNIYMRLFIRSYVKYIDADYKQALVDYELHTTGKIQPKFFETEQNDTIAEQKSSVNAGNQIGEDFQINYKQVITIALTIIAIYLGFKLVEFISNDNSDEKTEEIINPSPATSETNQSAVTISDLSILTNEDFKNGEFAYQITEIIPLNSNKASLMVKTLDNTKINILTHHKNDVVFF